MRIQYYLSDGSEVIYDTIADIPTLQDIDNLALKYAELKPSDLPDSVFVSVRIYRDMMSSIYNAKIMNDKPTGMNLIHIHTAVGVLRVIPIPMASDAKLILVGKREDFDRYDIDKIFEETVLKDCDREK